MDRRVLKRGLRLAVVAVLALVSLVLIALEMWYRSLLPAALPQPSAMTAPKLVRDAIWLQDCAGLGDPQLHRVYPFLLGSLVAGRGADLSLSAGLARMSLAPESPRESSVKRMLREMALATWISRHWTVEQALDTYASLSWMGDDRYGVHDGALFLFGKDLSALTVAEIALLVATIRSPTAFSPLCHPERALKARNDLLQRMDVAGLLDHRDVIVSLSASLGVRGECVARVEWNRPTTR